MAADALWQVIARVRRAMPRNADVMAVCDAAERSIQVMPAVTENEKNVTVTRNRRGRPPTGKAMTVAERVRKHREAERGK
jgi:hypothetical protein